jgi:hypothetical protein
VALVPPDAVADRSEAEPFPDVDALVCVRVGPIPWTRALSDALGAEGIEHRVERDERSEEEGGIDPARFGHETLYGTWVRPGDAEAAGAVDRRLFAHLEPGRSEESEGGDVCPACAEPLAPDALECAGCGLAFG